MGKADKGSRKGPKHKADTRHQAEELSRQLGESAQQVWLAGVGAFGRAQAEGSKLFDTLVREGLSVEQSTRKAAAGRVDAVRDSIESTVGQARERATGTWDRLEKVFEERVQSALRRLDVPSREDVADLHRQVDTLNAELRRQRAGRARTPKPAASSAATAKKPAAPGKAAAGKAPRARKALPSRKPAAAAKRGTAQARKSVRKRVS